VWGFAIASQDNILLQPEPSQIDKLLAQKTTGNFQMLDGNLLRGMLQVPVYLQKAIEREIQVYAMAAPPEFLGERG
jgi:hypothetical protein